MFHLIQNKLMCSPIEQANDGVVDCLGATDEPTRCRHLYSTSDDRSFYCAIIRLIQHVCFPLTYVMVFKEFRAEQDDERFYDKKRTGKRFTSFCKSKLIFSASDIEKVLCNLVVLTNKLQIKYFKLDQKIESAQFHEESREVRWSPGVCRFPLADISDFIFVSLHLSVVSVSI